MSQKIDSIICDLAAQIKAGTISDKDMFSGFEQIVTEARKELIEQGANKCPDVSEQVCKRFENCQDCVLAFHSTHPYKMGE